MIGSLQRFGSALLLSAVIALVGCSRSNYASSNGSGAQSVKLLNVSYDPTHELWRELNSAFQSAYKSKTGIDVTIEQSHGGSSTQAAVGH